MSKNPGSPKDDNLVIGTGPAHGTISFNPNGTFDYFPDAGFSGTDTFQYSVADTDGVVAPATVEIDVTPVNDAPTTNDDSITTDEDTSADITVLGNETDPDLDVLSVNPIVTTAPTNGSAIVNSDGTITYTPDPDFQETDTFKYEVCDADGECDIETVTVTVDPVNDSQVAVDDSFTTPEDTPITASVEENDFDPDGEPLVFVLVTAPTSGTFSLAPDGMFTFDPAPNFVGTVTFEYEACDLDCVCRTATASIEVTAINGAPTGIDDSGTTTEDTTVTINLLDNDTDPDDVTLTVSEINGQFIVPDQTIELPTGALVTLNGGGTATYDPNGEFENLANGQSVIDTFTYTISDPSGERSTAEAVVLINGANDVPVAEDDFIKTTVDTPVIMNVLGNDVDLEGSPLAVILLNTPANGTATVNPDGTITYVPHPGWEGTVTLHYLVEDPDGGSSDATVTIEVESAFRFDSFTDFSKSHSARSAVNQMPTSDRILSQKIITLAPEPNFSGYARPGTQIVGRIYDSSGALISEARSNTDPGGNWMMQFQGTRGHDCYRVEFEQVSAGATDVFGYLELNPSDHSYESMDPTTACGGPLSVENAMETSQDSLESSHRNNSNPLGQGRNE